MITLRLLRNTEVRIYSSLATIYFFFFIIVLTNVFCYFFFFRTALVFLMFSFFFLANASLWRIAGILVSESIFLHRELILLHYFLVNC